MFKMLFRKKYIVIVIVIIVLLLAVFVIHSQRTSMLQGELVLTADPAGLPAINELFRDFNAKYPRVKITVNTARDIDIAYNSVTTGQADAALAYQHPGARLLGDDTTFIITGKDHFNIITNSENPVSSITEKQLLDVYFGKVNDWSSLGGTKLSIIPYVYKTGNPLDTILAKVLSVNGLRYSERVTQVKSFDEMDARVSKEAGAIGFTLASRALADKVKVIPFKGENSVSVSHLKPGDIHTLEWCLVFRNKNRTQALKAFIQYAKTKKAENVFSKYMAPVG